jgi:L,D-transpeptidase YcbB
MIAAITSVACERPSSGQSVRAPEKKLSAPVERQSAPSNSSATESTQLREALQSKGKLKVADNSLDGAPLRQVYENRQFQPMWTGSRGAESDAARVLDQLRHAGDDGLRPEDYRVEHLTVMAADEHAKSSSDFELLMTDSVLRYAHDLKSGRVKPTDVDEDVALPAIGFNYAKALSDAAASHNVARYLTDMAPNQLDYVRLKQALAQYRGVAAVGGWAMLPAGTNAQGANAIALRARLRAEDGSVANDPNLPGAVQRFQKRNGLTADGIVGPKTLAALNVPVEERVHQIEANMERLRWMPHKFEARYIAVNAADATLKFVANGEAVLESKVVVGQSDWRTPILRTEARAITVNPIWRVPSSIAKKEILPQLQKDPHYLESEGLVLVNGPANDPYGLSIDWSSKDDIPYNVQQPAGPKNALGTLKFEMPNKFDVYLHDTPAKFAFAQETRTLSHGCIRVEQIAPLVSLAAYGDTQSGVSRINEMIASGESKKLPLDQPIPVYLLYWTAFADQDGAVNFRPDVYGRDTALLAALKGEHVERPAIAELGI